VQKNLESFSKQTVKIVSGKVLSKILKMFLKYNPEN